MARIARSFATESYNGLYFSVEAKNLDEDKTELIKLRCEKFRLDLKQLVDTWEFDECGQEVIINLDQSESRW